MIILNNASLLDDIYKAKQDNHIEFRIVCDKSHYIYSCDDYIMEIIENTIFDRKFFNLAHFKNTFIAILNILCDNKYYATLSVDYTDIDRQLIFIYLEF